MLGGLKKQSLNRSADLVKSRALVEFLWDKKQQFQMRVSSSGVLYAYQRKGPAPSSSQQYNNERMLYAYTCKKKYTLGQELLKMNKISD